MKYFVKVFLLVPALLWAQTEIYRSIGVANAIWSDGSGTRTFTISGSTLTFSTSSPDTLGKGVCIEYDSTGLNLLIQTPIFIHGRTSSTVYTVKRDNGGTPPAVTNASLWNVFHSYTTIVNIPAGGENANIGPAFDGTSRNLVTLNQTFIIVGYNIADSIAPAGMNWPNNFITGTSNRIKIITPVTTSEVGRSQRHVGKYPTYGYRIFRNSATAATMITFSNGTSEAEHVEIDGVAFKVSGTGAQTATYFGDLPADGIALISNCIYVGSDSVSTQTNHMAIFGFGGASGSAIKVSNTIVYGFKTSGSTTNEAGIFTGTTFSGSILCNNVTIYKTESSFRRGAGTMTTNNCISQRSDNGWNGTIGGNFNISDLSSDAPGANSQNSTTVTFVSHATNNFLLAAASNGIDDGTDLSGGDPAVTKDILGASRPQGSAYDIGAHEFPVANAPTFRRVIQTGNSEILLFIAAALLLLGLVRRKAKKLN